MNREERAERADAIMRAWRTGLKSSEIALMVGLSRSQVNRIIRIERAPKKMAQRAEAIAIRAEHARRDAKAREFIKGYDAGVIAGFEKAQTGWRAPHERPPLPFSRETPLDIRAAVEGWLRRR